MRAMPDTIQVMKTATAFRLSAGAHKLLDVLSRRLGLSKASVVELALRRLAALEGVPIPDEQEAADAGPD